MSRNRYYYYDHDLCDFVELEKSRGKMVAQFTGIAVTAVVIGLALLYGFDRFYNTPEELALKTENEALQLQLEMVGDRMSVVQQQLDELAAEDQDLYRTILQADPISADIRRVGVGGSDPYEQHDRFSPRTAQLLRRSGETLDLLERRIKLQSLSYQELTEAAQNHELRLAEMPAILPADGPVVSGFGRRMHPILKIVRPHNGIDILVPRGSKIVAPGDGVVKEAGRGGGLGKYVRLVHRSTGYVTTFAHLSKIPDHIRPGAEVKRGELIGLSGNTGLSKAPHLHYEVRDQRGKAYNPVFFFAPTMTPQQYQKLLADSEKGTSSLD